MDKPCYVMSGASYGSPRFNTEASLARNQTNIVEKHLHFDRFMKSNLSECISLTPPIVLFDYK